LQFGPQAEAAIYVTCPGKLYSSPDTWAALATGRANPRVKR
jgi:hypothetical protein